MGLLFFFLNCKLFHEFSDVGLDFNSHGDNRMVLNVWDLKLLDRDNDSEIGFKELFIDLKQVVFFIKFQVLEQFQDPFKLLPHILFRKSLLFFILNLWF